MKMTYKQLEAVVEQIQEWTDYDVEVAGYRDYEVVPYIDKKMMPDLLIEINKIIRSNRKWWQFWR